MSKDRRVVITGIGLITPLGVGVKSSWDNLISGISGIKRIVNFDTTRLACKIAGVVESFEAEKYIEARDINKMDLFIQYGIAAATEAINDSGWVPSDERAALRTGVILGSGIGGLRMIEDTAVKFHTSHSNKISPFFIPSSLINLLSGHVSIKYGFTGPNHSAVTACSTGAHAIGDAFRMIQYGNVDVVVAGGAESPITPIGIAGFVAARALSLGYNDSPQSASRPWDKKRDGFVMGEGSGVVVLEEFEHARMRGAKIYAEIVGYGSSSDAYHITAPHPQGYGAYRSMILALNDAAINTNKIDYINAHGTSTQIGDLVELKAVQKLFLDSNPQLLMSSTKSSTGHLLGASGSMELIFSVLAIKNQLVPATLNLYDPLDEVKLDLVPLIPKEKKLDYVLSNSFGFGGTNASLILKKV